jgi:hypothetical protein
MDRYDPFKRAFEASGSSPSPAVARVLSATLLKAVPDFTNVIIGLAGKVLNGGLYRLFDDTLFEAAEAFIDEAYPAWKDHLGPFGCDWMGRIYAVDGSKRRDANGQLCAVLLDPATRDLLKVPASVGDFHNLVAVSDPNLAFESDLWTIWRQQSGRDLEYGEVAGWKVPAFLGGQLDLANLEVQLIRVYWGIASQLIAQTFKLREGTPIRSVKNE